MVHHLYQVSSNGLPPPLITNFRFGLTPLNQMLFINIVYPTKGAHAICWPKYKEKDKVVLLIYLPTLRQWIMDSECRLSQSIGSCLRFNWLHLLEKVDSLSKQLQWKLSNCPSTNERPRNLSHTLL